MSRASVPATVDLFSKLKFMGFMVLLLITFGTVSFQVLLDISPKDAFIMTLESLAFLAHDIEGPARVIQGFLSIVGLVIVWWAIWSTFDIIFDEGFREYLAEYRISKKVNKMKDHYIIAGGGRVGDEIAERFLLKQTPFVIVEVDQRKVRELQRAGMMAICGDATDATILKKANIATAKAIIIAIPQAEKNLLAVLLSKELHPDILVYARSENPDYVPVLQKAGAHKVTVPEIAAAEEILQDIG